MAIPYGLLSQTQLQNQKLGPFGYGILGPDANGYWQGNQFIAPQFTPKASGGLLPPSGLAAQPAPTTTDPNAEKQRQEDDQRRLLASYPGPGDGKGGTQPESGTGTGFANAFQDLTGGLLGGLGFGRGAPAPSMDPNEMGSRSTSPAPSMDPNDMASGGTAPAGQPGASAPSMSPNDMSAYSGGVAPTGQQDFIGINNAFNDQNPAGKSEVTGAAPSRSSPPGINMNTGAAEIDPNTGQPAGLGRSAPTAAPAPTSTINRGLANDIAAVQKGMQLSVAPPSTAVSPQSLGLTPATGLGGIAPGAQQQKSSTAADEEKADENAPVAVNAPPSPNAPPADMPALGMLTRGFLSNPAVAASLSPTQSQAEAQANTQAAAEAQAQAMADAIAGADGVNNAVDPSVGGTGGPGVSAGGTTDDNPDHHGPDSPYYKGGRVKPPKTDTVKGPDDQKGTLKGKEFVINATMTKMMDRHAPGLLNKLDRSQKKLGLLHGWR